MKRILAALLMVPILLFVPVLLLPPRLQAMTYEDYIESIRKKS